jgi:outer membrane protein assembly factor BamB
VVFWALAELHWKELHMTLFCCRFTRLGYVLAMVTLVLAGGTPSTADDWPQWQGPKRDGVWRESGIVEKFPPGGPKVLWRAELGGGFAGPAVADGRVYVMDRRGEMLGKGKEGPPKGGLKGKERILSLDAADGKPLWVHEYDCDYRILYPSGPRSTPVVHQGKLYSLGAMGDVFCLDAAKGKVHWHKRLLDEYKAKTPLWGYAAHPLVDGDRVICLAGGAGSAVVALHKDTGKELWRALTVEEIGYAPPMIFEAGGKRQLIVWHTEAINSLDPETGKLYWSEKFPLNEPVRPAITVGTPRLEKDLLFVSSPHHGSLMLKLAADRPAATVLWRGKSDNLAKPDGLHSLMSSPVLRDGHVYGVCNFGQLRCLKADTGKLLWEHQTSERKALATTTFLIPQGDRFFLFSDQGDLIIARLTPKGYEEIDRAHVLEPTLFSRGRDVVWSHPAFANGCVFLRNDKEIRCLSLKSA